MEDQTEKAEHLQSLNQNSIRLSRSVKGIYTWDIKRYYSDDDGDEDVAIEKLISLDNRLRGEFPTG